MSANQKTYKFLFNAEITQFNLKANINCKIIVCWKRSNQSASSLPTQLVGGKANINQSLSLPVNMYMDIDSKVFIQKKSVFSFTMQTPKGDKTAGVVNVDLSQILNKKLDFMEEKFSLEKCPAAGAYVHIKISAKMQQGKCEDAKSIQSQSFFNDNQSMMSLPSETKLEEPFEKDKINGQKVKMEETISKLNKQNRDLKDQVKVLRKALMEQKNQLNTGCNNKQSPITELQLSNIRGKLQCIYQNLKNNLDLID